MLYLVSFLLLSLMALTCIGLGAAIFARVERSAEVTALLALMLLLGASYLALGMGDLLYGVLHGIEMKTYYLCSRISIMLFFAAAAVGGHFQSLTLDRVFRADRDVRVTYKRWAALNIPQLQEARPLSFWRGINHRFYMVASYLMGALGILVYAVVTVRVMRGGYRWEEGFPKAVGAREGGLIGGAIGGLVGLYGPLQLYIVSAIYQRLPESAQQFPRAGRFFEKIGNSMTVGVACFDSNEPFIGRSASLDEWKAFLALGAGTVLGGLLVVARAVVGVMVRRSQWPRELLGVVNLGLLLLPLGVLLPLVYYKMRFVFFDTLIKRGLLLAGLLATSGIWVFGGVLPLQRMAAARAASTGPVVLWAGILSFAAAWIAAHRRAVGALDRYLFQRPDYATLLPEIGNELRNRFAADEAIDCVTERLRRELGANEVTVVTQDAPPAPAEARAARTEVAIAVDGRHFGALRCGERLRGQQYQSEDLLFLRAVATELARALRQIELREEHEQQARREQALRELAARSELKALRAQINPHFLFNALNIAIDLTEDDPRLAGETLLHLSHVFRYALDATRREAVPLGEELDFIRAYLLVERARFEEKLRFEIAAGEECRSLLIPPMLIQPLVENAIKHGIAPKIGGGCVRIEVRRADGAVCVRVADDGVGFDTSQGPARVPSANGSGIGLANVRERVAKLYGEDRWRLESAPGRGTVIEFEIGRDAV